MATFITRVELYGSPTWQHYENLHAQMERRGFTRTIKSDDGTVYDLPSAMYHRIASSTKASILEDAKTAANAVWSDNGVIVSETNGSTWRGLRVHKSRRYA